jgi:hypothetical protein
MRTSQTSEPVIDEIIEVLTTLLASRNLKTANHAKVATFDVRCQAL